MRRPAFHVFLTVTLLRTATAAAQVNGPLPAPLPLFPATHWWNLDVSAAPVDPASDAILAYIGGEGMHPDFGGDVEGSATAIYGMPFISVPNSQPLVPVTFVEYATQSDAADPCSTAGYPIPPAAKTEAKWIEGGAIGGGNSGDRHMLIVDRDDKILYELYHAHWNATFNGGVGRWEAGSGAIWPLETDLRRPDGWTSADAAGMAILPGLIRYDEAYGANPILHAFRMTVHGVNGYVFPASHYATTDDNPDAPPLGARLRLKAGKDISGYPAHIQRIFQAMKTYGLIVADTGSDMYVQGTYNALWDNDQLNPYFDDLHASDFEVIRLGWRPADAPVVRAQLAVAMLRALENRCYLPPDPTCATPFGDVTCPADPYASWIEDLQDRGVVNACAPGVFCPLSPVTRGELAMHLVRAHHVPGYVPPACASTAPYGDFNCAHPYAAWIMRAWTENLLGGCDTTHYCPNDPAECDNPIRFCPNDAVDRIQLEQILANDF